MFLLNLSTFLLFFCFFFFNIMLSPWKLSVTWWRKPTSHRFLVLCLALVQHSSFVELKIKSITFSRDWKVLPSAVLEQLSRGVAWMVQTCRSRELFALPHNAKTWRLNPNPAPRVSSICSFDIWLVYSMNMSPTYGDWNSLKSNFRCQEIGWFRSFPHG